MSGVYRICSRCILDTTVPEITFDEEGVCNYCKLHDRIIEKYPTGDEGRRQLNKLVNRIKGSGGGRDYDCVVGVSGGTDSTYTLHLAKEYGLRPLAVHVDNGWNSELSVANIEKVTSKLDVDLHTIVLDWEEFRDLQISFLKASVPDAEIPTDIAIFGALHETAAREKISYILNGHSFRTQGTCPRGWTYMDGRYVQSVQERFGTRELKSYPNLTLTKLFYYRILKRIKVASLLEYLDYHKEEASRFLQDELGWTPYEGKHYESIYTRFFQSYILPKKFNIDKRKVHYSALVRSGQMSRGKALEKIKEPPISEEKAREDRDYVIKKLGLTNEEFEDIMSQPPKTSHDYSTYYPMIKAMKLPIKIACKLHILPMRFYEKYAK